MLAFKDQQRLLLIYGDLEEKPALMNIAGVKGHIDQRRLRLTSRYGNVTRSTITSMSATPTRGRGMELDLVLTGEARITLTVRGLGGRLVKQVSQDASAGNVRVVWDRSTKASDAFRFKPSAMPTAMPSPWPSEPPVISMPGV